MKQIHRNKFKHSKGEPNCEVCNGTGLLNNDDVDDCWCVKEYQKKLRNKKNNKAQ